MSRSAATFAVFLLLSFAVPARASVVVSELMGNIDDIGLDEDEVEAARLYLSSRKMKKRDLKAERELRSVAKAYGKTQAAVPTVEGECIGKKGDGSDCEPFKGVMLYSIEVGGEARCHGAVLSALDQLRGLVLRKVRDGESTGSRYFDKFLLYLAEQFTEKGKAGDLPSAAEGPAPIENAIATYSPSLQHMTFDPRFCGMGAALQRKVVGHELFHHWDNGRDGSPIPAGDSAEPPAYAVMRHL